MGQRKRGSQDLGYVALLQWPPPGVFSEAKVEVVGVSLCAAVKWFVSRIMRRDEMTAVLIPLFHQNRSGVLRL